MANSSVCLLRLLIHHTCHVFEPANETCLFFFPFNQDTFSFGEAETPGMAAGKASCMPASSTLPSPKPPFLGWVGGGIPFQAAPCPCVKIVWVLGREGGRAESPKSRLQMLFHKGREWRISLWAKANGPAESALPACLPAMWETGLRCHLPVRVTQLDARGSASGLARVTQVSVLALFNL